MTDKKEETKTIFVSMCHGEYPINQFAKDVGLEHTQIADGQELEEMIGEEKTQQVMGLFTEDYPHLLSYMLDLEGSVWLTIERYTGTFEQFQAAAKSYCDQLIPSVYESGGDDDHFDYIPSAVDELINFCQQFGDLTEVQRLYDSLWQGPPIHLQKKPTSASWDWVQNLANDDLSKAELMNWSDHSAHYPLQEYAEDPGIHCYFEIEGIQLHADHPKETKI